METKITENKITIEFTKEEDKNLFDRAIIVEDPKAYFEYLLKLDYTLNGDDSDVIIGYDNIEHFEYFAKKWNYSKIKRTQQKILKDMLTSIDLLNKSIPDEYRFNLYDCRYTFFADNDLMSSLKYAADRLRILLKLIAKEEKIAKNNSNNFSSLIDEVNSFVDENKDIENIAKKKNKNI